MPPTATQAPLPVTISVYFTDTLRVGNQLPPFSEAVQREIPASANPITAAVDEYFKGPSSAEQARGLIVMRNGFLTYRRLEFANGLLAMSLAGNCRPNGTSYSIAQPLIQTVKQFMDVRYVKIYDEYDHTRDPFSQTDSWPVCLDTIFTATATPVPTGTATPHTSATPSFAPTAIPSGAPRSSSRDTITTTRSPIPTATLVASKTRTPTPRPTASFTPSRMPARSPVLAPTASATPLPSKTSTRAPAPLPVATLVATRTPTKTPIPSGSSTSDLQCTRATFVSDVTIADNDIVPAGQPFTKTWRIKNTGSCPWRGTYGLVFISGDQMSAPGSVLLSANVAPAETTDVSVTLVAPEKPGEYQGFWQLVTPEGRAVGLGASGIGNLWVKVRVIGTAPSTAGAPTSTFQAVAQPTGTAPVKKDFVVHACDGLWQSIDGMLPCPGQDGDPRGFVLPMNQVYLEGGGPATLPTLLTFPSSLKDGYIRGLYTAYQVAAGDHFQASVGCELNAVSCSVLFRLSYLDVASAAHDLWTVREFYDGKLSNLDLDLSPLAGKEVRFVLSVEDLGSSAGDRAVWLGPRIVHISGIPLSSVETSTSTLPAPLATATASATFASPPGSSAATPVPTPPRAGEQYPPPLVTQIIQTIISFLRQLLSGK